MKVKINPAQLFLSTNDVRKYLGVDMPEDEKELLAVENEISIDTVDNVLSEARMYVRSILLPETIEVEIEED